MYPNNLTELYANLTPRSFEHMKSIIPEAKYFNDKYVVYGISSSIQEMNKAFDIFFAIPKEQALEQFKQAILPFIGCNSPTPIVEKMAALHDLGYLPLRIKSLPEGTYVKAGIPVLTVKNTHKRFAWLVTYIETFLSSQIWKLMTAATIAGIYHRIYVDFAKQTGTPLDFVQYQGHDFSARGMSGAIDAARTGSAHLVFFNGTDGVSALQYARKYYAAEQFDGVSIPASEHSVMTLGLEEGELNTFRRIFSIYPSGAVSIVSDSYDYWDTITNKARTLKDEIMSRTKDAIGLCKTVFRPDSGDPVRTIVGTPIDELPTNEVQLTPEQKGSVECLYDIFGGTVTDTGFKQLDEHVGLIYGDSITPIRAYQMLQGLRDKGYASGNIVHGIGSFTYNYLTRDTLGIAYKVTAARLDDKLVKVYKKPKTDSGKNSAKGYLRVDLVDNEYVLVDNLTSDDGGELQVLFNNGEFNSLPTLKEIRERARQF